MGGCLPGLILLRMRGLLYFLEKFRRQHANCFWKHLGKVEE